MPNDRTTPTSRIVLPPAADRVDYYHELRALAGDALFYGEIDVAVAAAAAARDTAEDLAAELRDALDAAEVA